MKDEMKTMIAALLLLFASVGFADVRVSVFDQRLVLIEAERIDVSQLLADSAQLKDKAGVVIHLTGATISDAELGALLSRLTDEPLHNDRLRIEPATGWRLLRPLVLSVPPEWKDKPLLQLFMRQRPWAELETSGQVERAKKRLRELVMKAQNELRSKLERMFR
jgi:hypothetical protein